MEEPSWIGKTLNGRYRIETLLGQGGMSAVYRATDPNLQRVVAVKMIHTHLSNSPDFMQRFEDEAAAVARLRHHHIIQVYDFNHDGDTYYIVFEYLPGETLHDRLRHLNMENRRLSIEEAVNIAAAVADALDYAHRRELIHRDIKPANVMLNPQGEAVLMDFGIAKIVDSTQRTATGVVLGTARYMSPEQIKGERVDARTDQYSLGAMLFEMVSGRAPYEADSAMTMMMMHIHDPAPNIADLRPDVPAPLAGVIARALSKEPQKRFATAAEMAAALRNVLASPVVQSRRPSEPTQVEALLAPTEVVAAPSAAQAAPAYAAPSARAAEFASPAQLPRPATPAAKPSEFPTPAPLPRSSPPAARLNAKGGSLKWIILGGAALFLLVIGLFGIGLASRFLLTRATTASDGQAPVELVNDRPSPTPMPEVTITNITTVSDFYVVQYNVTGFEESPDGLHLHFFFNTTPPQEAGRPFSSFFMYAGRSPYAEIRLSDKPAEATKLCALVANPDHTIQGESGNCFDLPNP